MPLYPALLDGVAAQREGRFADAARHLDEAARGAEAAGMVGTFSHMLILLHRTQIDFFGQDVAAFDASIGRMREAARESDLFAMRCYVIAWSMANAFVHGRFEEARDLMADTDALFPRGRITLQRLFMDAYRCMPELYLTDGREARRSLAAMLTRGRGFMLLRFMYSGALSSLAALLEANALRSGDPDASARTVARYAAIAADAPPLMATGGWRARAYAASAEGRDEAALALLEVAEAEAGRWGQGIDVAIARYQRGRRLGGDEGESLVVGARRLIAETGASEQLLDEDAGLR